MLRGNYDAFFPFCLVGTFTQAISTPEKQPPIQAARGREIGIQKIRNQQLTGRQDRRSCRSERGRDLGNGEPSVFLSVARALDQRVPTFATENERRERDRESDDVPAPCPTKGPRGKGPREEAGGRAPRRTRGTAETRARAEDAGRGPSSPSRARTTTT